MLDRNKREEKARKRVIKYAVKSSSTSGVVKNSMLSEHQTCHPPGNTNSFIISRDIRQDIHKCLYNTGRSKGFRWRDHYKAINVIHSVINTMKCITLYPLLSCGVSPHKRLIQLTCLKIQSALIHLNSAVLHTCDNDFKIFKITCNFLLTAAQSNPFVGCILWHL